MARTLTDLTREYIGFQTIQLLDLQTQLEVALERIKELEMQLGKKNE